MKSTVLLLLVASAAASASVAHADDPHRIELHPGNMPVELGGQFDAGTILQDGHRGAIHYPVSPPMTLSLPDGAPNGIRLRGGLEMLEIKTPAGKLVVDRTSGDFEYVLPAMAPGDIELFPPFTRHGWGGFTVEVIGKHPWPDALPTVEVAGGDMPAPVIMGVDAVGKDWAPVSVVHFTKPTGMYANGFGDHPEIRWRKYFEDGTTYRSETLGGAAADDSFVLEVKGTGHVTVVLWQGDGKMKIDPLASIQPVPDNLPVEKRHAEDYFLVGLTQPEVMTFAERQQLFAKAGPALWSYPTVDLDNDGPKQGEPVLVIMTRVYTADGMMFDAPDPKLLAATGGAIPANARPFDLGPKLALHASKDPQRDLDDPRVAPVAAKYKAMSDRYYACVTKILDKYGADAADFDVVTYDTTGHIKSVENLRSKGWREAEGRCGSRDVLAKKLLVVAKQASDAFQASRQERMDKMR
jgi:hypothetical protein